MRQKIPKTPLMIRHFIKGRFVRATQIRGAKCVIGSGQGNKVRLISPKVAGVCCILERNNGVWTIIDVGSQPDLKLNGKPFIEETLDRKFALEVEDHRLEFLPVVPRRQIFTADFKDVKKGDSLTVVKWNGRVLETLDDENEIKLFEKMEHPGVEVEKVYRGKVPQLGREKLQFDPDMKKPLTATALAIVIFFAILFGLPMPKEDAVRPNDNVYTRMIFDSKVLTQKKKQLVSFGVKSPKGTGNGNGSISEGTKGAQSKAVKAVASLRQSGLQSLIGKIAGRATNSAKMLAALAATPTAEAAVDHDLSQMGMPSTNAATGKAGIVGNGQGYKIGGIGTGGKGGGTGGYKSGTGLGTGAIGNGEVGLEDQDSVVEGGLDREVIAGIIREHLGQIRYCYERQLSANPDLYGKIKVRFSIDAEGSVDTQSIGQSTLNSAMVEECILRRIATWKFPKPKGGTKVLVSYPFLFKSVN